MFFINSDVFEQNYNDFDSVVYFCIGKVLQVPWSVYGDEYHSGWLWTPVPCSACLQLHQ